MADAYLKPERAEAFLSLMRREDLVSLFADAVISNAYVTNQTPQEMLRRIADTYPISERQWNETVRPELERVERTRPERKPPFVVIVVKKHGKTVTSLTRGIAANSVVPTTHEEAKDHVLEYAGPLTDGDTIYVIRSDAVAVYRAKGHPEVVLDHEVGERMF